MVKLYGAPQLPASATKAPGPYPEASLNRIYDSFFCDDPSVYRPKPDKQPSAWQAVLFSPDPDAVAVRGLAEDPVHESRIRMLACNWLRQRGLAIARKELLGVISELRLEGGLLVVAAYTDGTVRYIGRTGKLVLFESTPASVADQAGKLLAASRTAIGHIGPWKLARLPPPVEGNIRMTFLVSDGFYFGEGDAASMQQDPVGAPVVRATRELEESVIDAVRKGQQMKAATGSKEPDAIKGIVSLRASQSVDETVEKVKSLLQAKNVKLFAVVDHSGEARSAGMKMPDTKLLIFGNPAGGTPAMLAAPTLALDLPLKILVWEDAQAQVWISYNSLEHLRERHGVPAELAEKLVLIESLAAAVAS